MKSVGSSSHGSSFVTATTDLWWRRRWSDDTVNDSYRVTIAHIHYWCYVQIYCCGDWFVVSFFLMSLLINRMSSWAVVIKCQIHQSFLPNNPHMDFYGLISYAQVFLVCWRIQLFFQIFLLQIVECKQKAIESTPAWEEKGLNLFCFNSEGFGNSNMECSAVQVHMEMGVIANILGSSLFFCSSVFWCACYPFIAQCLVTFLDQSQIYAHFIVY
jgi:hypothetical protein